MTMVNTRHDFGMSRIHGGYVYSNDSIVTNGLVMFFVWVRLLVFSSRCSLRHGKKCQLEISFFERDKMMAFHIVMLTSCRPALSNPKHNPLELDP